MFRKPSAQEKTARASTISVETMDALLCTGFRSAYCG
jgi:hypothetical protein